MKAVDACQSYRTAGNFHKRMIVAHRTRDRDAKYLKPKTVILEVSTSRARPRDRAQAGRVTNSTLPRRIQTRAPVTPASREPAHSTYGWGSFFPADAGGGAGRPSPLPPVSPRSPRPASTSPPPAGARLTALGTISPATLSMAAAASLMAAPTTSPGTGASASAATGGRPRASTTAASSSCIDSSSPPHSMQA